MRRPNHQGYMGLLGLALLVTVSGCSLLEPSSTIRTDEPELYLFVQTASSGTLTPTADAAGEFSLTLQNVSPNVVFFSDKPYRDSGAMQVGDYLAAIFEPSSTNPNAALVIAAQNGMSTLTLALELSEPIYDGAMRTMTYQVRPLSYVPDGLSHLSFDEAKSLPAQFGSSELFIDSDNYHRCFGRLNNNTSNTYTLDHDSFDPSYDNGNNWGSDRPPDTVNDEEIVNWTFRYHSENNEKKAQFDYVWNGGDSGTYRITFKMACHVGGNSRGHVNFTKSDCSVSPSGARFECWLDEDNSTDQQAVFKIDNR